MRPGGTRQMAPYGYGLSRDGRTGVVLLTGRKGGEDTYVLVNLRDDPKFREPFYIESQRLSEDLVSLVLADFGDYIPEICPYDELMATRHQRDTQGRAQAAQYTSWLSQPNAPATHWLPDWPELKAGFDRFIQEKGFNPFYARVLDYLVFRIKRGN